MGTVIYGIVRDKRSSIMRYTIKMCWAIWLGAIVLCGFVCAQTESVESQTQVTSIPGQVPPLPPRLPAGIPAFPGAWGGG